MATHSSILAWRILWTEEPGGLLSIRSHRVRHDWSNWACMHALEKEMAAHSSILAWRIPGTEEPGGLLSTGLQRVRHDWSDTAAAAAAALPKAALLLYPDKHKSWRYADFRVYSCEWKQSFYLMVILYHTDCCDSSDVDQVSSMHGSFFWAFHLILSLLVYLSLCLYHSVLIIIDFS